MRRAGSGFVLCLVAVALAETASPGDPPPPPPSPVVPSRMEIGDAETPRPRREVHDVVTAVFEAKDRVLHVAIRFKRPLLEGTFECVHLYVDCDANAGTGIDGADLWVRASVGSRFQPTNAEPPSKGAPAPASLRRSSYSAPRALEARGVEERRLEWVNFTSTSLRPPVVEGKEVSFDVPLSMIVAEGLRYNRFVRLRAEVEGTCSTHPLSLAYTCADEGTPVLLDGKDDDWSGQAHADRPPGAMHPDTTEVEITSLLVDHDASRLFVLVRLAADGFSSPGQDDVQDGDTVTIGLEPLGGGGYMEYREVTVAPGPALAHIGSPAVVLGPRLVEAAFPRRREQTTFRVLAWSDARRIDKVPNAGWLPLGIPPEALRAK